LGIGCGYHIEELEKKYPDKNKIVIEPDRNVFLKLLNTRDITHLISSKNILFIISDIPRKSQRFSCCSEKKEK